MSRISLVESLKVLQAARTDQIVLTTMGSAREWMKLGPPNPLDFPYVPSAMGELPALALGLALAKPQRQVIACNGDGGMLMNLGSLVTITAESPANLVLIVFDNGVYEVTGTQWTAAADPARRGGEIDFCTIARGCGFQSVFAFDRLDDWRARIGEVLSARGPTFVVLSVEPVPGGEVPKSPGPPPQRAREFAEALRRI